MMSRSHWIYAFLWYTVAWQDNWLALCWVTSQQGNESDQIYLIINFFMPFFLAVFSLASLYCSNNLLGVIHMNVRVPFQGLTCFIEAHHILPPNFKPCLQTDSFTFWVLANILSQGGHQLTKTPCRTTHECHFLCKHLTEIADRMFVCLSHTGGQNFIMSLVSNPITKPPIID